MTFKSLSIVSMLSFFLVACGNQYKLELSSPKELQVNKKLNVSVTEKSGKEIDSINYYLDGVKLSSPKEIDISNIKLGKHAISATVFFEQKQKQLTNTVYFLADKSPDLYTYEVVNEFPHDNEAFTQGLEFYNNYLYESTGQYGESGVRKVALETGEVQQKTDVDAAYFGEGITIFNDKLYFLTWKSKKGLIFNLQDLKEEKTFFYGASKEGWGLAHTADKLVKTDGSERIWLLNPETQKEEGFIEAYMHNGKLDKLNELEFINGKIYANSWQKDLVAIINPNTGAVEGIINLTGLQEKAGQKGDDNVLNGIAYDAENDRLFVTGKRWNKLFEIKIKKKS